MTTSPVAADRVRPLVSDDRPLLHTHNAFGTMFLHNTRPDATGRFFATRWFVVLLPIWPLGRYYLRQGRTNTSGGPFTSRTSTEYTLVGRSGLRGPEILRTYLLFWLAGPGLFIGPIVATAVQTERMDVADNSPYMAGAMGIALVLTAALVAGFWLYRTRWRPVRQARWAE